MTLGDLFELIRFLEHLRQASSETAEACTPSIVMLNERIEAAMQRLDAE